MTTTVPSMEETIALLKAKAPWCRTVVGGAVLTEDYAEKIGADKYAKEAMDTVNYALSFGKKEFASKHICGIQLRYYLDEASSFSVKLKNKHGTYVLSTIKEGAENKLLSANIPITCGEDADIIFEGNGRFVLTSLTVRYKETGIKN